MHITCFAQQQYSARMIQFSRALLIVMVCATSVVAQTDTTATDTASAGRNAAQKAGSGKFAAKWNMQPHSPLKATIFSTVLPGAGQAYNKKYWKMPIVYAGIGTCVGFIIYNNNKYQYYKGQYIAQIDGDPNTVPEINATNLDVIQEQYHRWRDVSYMALFGVYIFQIIDANVDGHLFYYNVDKDLTMQITPGIINTGSLQPALGLSFTF